jgi:adenylate kinase
MLARLGQPLQLALLVDVDQEVLMKRLTGRRNCSSAACGAIYNVYFSPPKSANKCDKCGSSLMHRSDDNEATVRSRLNVYEQKTAPLVSYYRAQNKLRSVKGVGAVAEIFKNICDIIEAQIRPLANVMGQAAAAVGKGKAAAGKSAGKAGKVAVSAKAPAAKKAAPSKPVKKAAPKKAAKKPAPKKAVKKKAAAKKAKPKAKAKKPK